MKYFIPSLALLSLGIFCGAGIAQDYKPKYILDNRLGLSSKQIQLYEENLQNICKAAGVEALKRWKENNRYHDKYGISRYFAAKDYSGWKPASTVWKFKERNPKKNKTYYQIAKVIDDNNLLEKLLPCDCTIHTEKTLEEGFREIPDEDWSKPWNTVFGRFDWRAENYNLKYKGTIGHNGIAMVKTLRYLGWKTYYFNTAGSDSEADKLRKYHFSHDDEFYNVVTSGGNYNAWPDSDGRSGFDLTVDDNKTFVGIKSPPKGLDDIDYCICVTNLGFHVFPIVNGYVIEGHAKYRINDRRNIERALFNPHGTLDPLTNKYRPNEEYPEKGELIGGRKYGPGNDLHTPGLSGIIAIPPHQEHYVKKQN